MPITVKHNPGAAAFGVPSYYAGQEDLRRYMDKMAQQQAEMMAKMQMNREDNAVKLSMQDAQIGAHQQAQVMGHAQDMQKMGINAQLQNKAQQDQFQFRADQEKFQQKEIAARQQEQIAAQAARQKDEIEARKKAVEDANKAKQDAEDAQKLEDAKAFRESYEAYKSSQDHPGEIDYNIGVTEALKTHDFSPAQNELLKDIEKRRKAISGSTLPLEEKKREIERLQDEKYTIYPGVKRPTAEEEIAASIKEHGDYYDQREENGRWVRKPGVKVTPLDKDHDNQRGVFDKVLGETKDEKAAWEASRSWEEKTTYDRRRVERDKELQEQKVPAQKRWEILDKEFPPYTPKHEMAKPQESTAGTKVRPSPDGSTPARPAPAPTPAGTATPATPAPAGIQPSQTPAQPAQGTVPYGSYTTPGIAPTTGNPVDRIRQYEADKKAAIEAIEAQRAGGQATPQAPVRDTSGTYQNVPGFVPLKPEEAAQRPGVVGTSNGIPVIDDPRVIETLTPGSRYKRGDTGEEGIVPAREEIIQDPTDSIKAEAERHPDPRVSHYSENWEGDAYYIRNHSDGSVTVKAPGYGEGHFKTKEEGEAFIATAKREEASAVVKIASPESKELHKIFNGDIPEFTTFRPVPESEQKKHGTIGYLPPFSRFNRGEESIPVFNSNEDAEKHSNGRRHAVKKGSRVQFFEPVTNSPN